jgi:putative ABC transport system ATP-binding protein
MDEHALADFRRKKIGFVFQQFNLVSTMTASDNVQFPMIFAGASASQRKTRAMSLLKNVGLADRGKHKPTELSGGQQQRVAVARALVNNPQIILADEPTGNLDSKVGAEIIALFKSMHEQGHTVILVSHDPSVVANVSRVVRLRDGKVVNE